MSPKASIEVCTAGPYSNGLASALVGLNKQQWPLQYEILIFNCMYVALPRITGDANAECNLPCALLDKTSPSFFKAASLNGVPQTNYV